MQRIVPARISSKLRRLIARAWSVLSSSELKGKSKNWDRSRWCRKSRFSNYWSQRSPNLPTPKGKTFNITSTTRQSKTRLMRWWEWSHCPWTLKSDASSKRTYPRCSSPKSRNSFAGSTSRVPWKCVQRLLPRRMNMRTYGETTALASCARERTRKRICLIWVNGLRRSPMKMNSTSSTKSTQTLDFFW